MPSAATPSRGRRLLWIALAILALAGIAWAALAAFLPPARVHAMVERQISTALAREARFRTASVTLFPPVRLIVGQPELAEPGGFARGSAISARALHLDLDVWALLRRRVLVRRLVLDRPAIHLVLRPDGTTNLDGVLEPEAEPARRPRQAMDLELREIRLDQAGFLVDDLAARRRTTFEVDSRLGVDVRREGRVATSGETHIERFAFGPLSAARIADLDASLADLEVGLEHRGAFDPERKRLALERLDVQLGDATLALSGVIDDPGPTAGMDLRVRGSNLDLGDLLSYLAVADAKAVNGIEGAGRLDLDLAVRGRLGPDRLPSLIGTLTVANGRFRYEGAPAGVEAVAFRARLAPDSLSIPDLRGRVTGPSLQKATPVRASLSVARFADPRASFAIEGGIDLGAIAPLVAPKDARLAGRADVAVRGRGRLKDPGAMSLQGQARLANVSVEMPQLPKKVEKVQGLIRFSESRASIQGLSLAAGKSSLTLNAEATRPLALLAKAGEAPPAQVRFDMRSPYLDLAELVPESQAAPTLPNATGHGDVAIGRLRQRKLDVQNVRASVDLAPDALQVPAFVFAGYGGQVRGQARFGLADPARPSFRVKADVDTLSADALLSAWTPVKGWIEGTLESDIELSGQGMTAQDVARTLTAVGLALVTNGTLKAGPALQEIAEVAGLPKLKEVRFRDMKMPFRVEHGRVITDPVVLEGAYGRWTLVGGIGFDGRLDYAVSITMPPAVAAAIGAQSAIAAGALSDGSGNVLIDLRVTGPAKAPKVRLDTQAMRDRLAGRVSQAVAEQREKLENEVREAAEARRAAAEDSARRAVARAKKAVEDSLRRRAGDVLKGFFGTRDTSPP